jgi:hypothetical protein
MPSPNSNATFPAALLPVLRLLGSADVEGFVYMAEADGCAEDQDRARKAKDDARHSSHDEQPDCDQNGADNSSDDPVDGT